MSDMGWTKHIEHWEDAQWERCYEAARLAGHSSEEADNCDDGSLNCPDCPWKEVKDELET
jgi:hypothetical protein